jgi:hypothetical protein
MQVKLKAEAGPVVIVADGAHYYAEFNCALEPFEIEEQHWPILERTGLFEPMKNEEREMKNEKAP